MNTVEEDKDSSEAVEEIEEWEKRLEEMIEEEGGIHCCSHWG
jgi:hypothetical protein